MNCWERVDHPYGRSRRFERAVNAYYGIAVSVFCIRVWTVPTANVFPPTLTITSHSSLSPSRDKNSVANCSSLMYFWRLNKDSRRVFSSRIWSLSIVSIASSRGAEVSLSNVRMNRVKMMRV